MKYLQLIWAAVLRRKMRSTLTLLSIAAAFLLFGLLDTVRCAFADLGQSAAGDTTLITLSKTSPGAALPVSLYPRIREVRGVAVVDFVYGFEGTYQGPRNSVYIETHTDALFSFPQVDVSPSERAAFRQTRTGALAGGALASKLGWKVGDRIPLKTSVVRQDGSDVWTFDIVGIFRLPESGLKAWENALFIHWEPFDQARHSDRGTVTYYASRIENQAEADAVAQAIDEISANSQYETKTQSDNAISADLIRQRGDFGLIVVLIMSAVFFALLLVTGHTIAHSVRERTAEFAVLKTIGFTGRKVMGLVLAESVFLLLLGSAMGLGAATVALAGASSAFASTLQIPIALVGSGVWLRGLTAAIAIALVVGVLPALSGLRLRVADALSSYR